MKVKNLVFPILFVLIAPITRGQSVSDFKKLTWLEGSWIRTNAKPGRSGVEWWKLSGVNEMTGRGISLKGVDTTFVEKLRITINDHVICYVADVPENQEPVYFRFTSLTGNGFVCENPAHDFPKKISYSLDGRKLTAVVSGNGKEIVYLYERN